MGIFDLGGTLNFHFVARFKIHHQEIAGLFCSFDLDKCFGRFHVFHSANPAHPTLYLNSENIEGLCQSEGAPTSGGRLYYNYVPRKMRPETRVRGPHSSECR